MGLRSLMLYLSRRKRLRRWMETSPVAERLTTRFIAGLTLDDGLAACERLEREGILVSMDRLGESVTSLAEAEASRDSYLEILHRIAASGFDASISIKLTQFGLDLSETACRANMERLVSEAARLGKTVEIDMESSEYTDRTLEIACAMHEAHGNVRAVVQAYLRRSEKDVERMCAQRVPVRLCKGAYKEPPELAFPDKKDVNANYDKLARLLLKAPNPAFATHDDDRIAAAVAAAGQAGLPKTTYEIQMLYGLRAKRWKELAAAGHVVRIYTPYGTHWFPYFCRRIRERKENLMFVLRNFFE